MADELITKQSVLDLGYKGGSLAGLIHAFKVEKLIAVDAVEVVRCRDCRYWESGENEAERWEYCTMTKCNKGPYGFCELGDRKENER